jgi:hypothetical protein
MDLKLDDNGDLEIGTDGDLVLVTGIDAIAQDLKTRLLFFKGEWDLDTRLGVPYFEEILKKAPDLNVVRSIYNDVITSTEGVLFVDDLTLEYDGPTRRLSVSFSCQTTAGPLTFEDELIIPIPR